MMWEDFHRIKKEMCESSLPCKRRNEAKVNNANKTWSLGPIVTWISLIERECKTVPEAP